MARPHKPWYRANRKTWYVEIAGKQHPLAKGPKAQTQQEAYRVMNRLLETADVPDANAAQDTVLSLLGRFLGWTKKNKAPATYAQRKHFLKSFVKHRKVKTLRPDRVTVEIVEEWLDAHPKWKAARRHAVLCLMRAFNWAVKRKKIGVNPIAGIDIPRQRRVLSYLTSDQRKTVFDATKDKAFKNFLTALEQTGCRPGEISAVEAKHANLEAGVWVLPQHKTAEKTGKPRTVYLTPVMLAMTKELAAKHPERPLFLNYRRKPWNVNSVRCRFRQLRKRFPKFGHFTAYSFRRAFVTDALERGWTWRRWPSWSGTPRPRWSCGTTTSSRSGWPTCGRWRRRRRGEKEQGA